MICGNDAIEFYKKRIEELEIIYEMDRSEDSLLLINSFNSFLEKELCNFPILRFLMDLRFRFIDKRNFIDSFNKISQIELDSILSMDQIFESDLKLNNNMVCFRHSLDKKSSIELVEEFFYSIGNKFILDEYIKIRDNKLPNIYLARGNIMDINHGVTFFDHLSNESFAKINMTHTLCDPITIAHEIMHMIFFNFFNKLDYYYLMEIEGFFSDYLFADFLNKRKITKHSAFQINYESFFNLTDSCKVVKKANNYFNSDKKIQFIDYRNDPQTAVDYNLSFLAALDLFFLYLEKPSLAFEELLSFSSKSKDVTTNLFNNNRYPNFYRDDFQNLRYTIKQMKKTKI